MGPIADDVSKQRFSLHVVTSADDAIGTVHIFDRGVRLAIGGEVSVTFDSCQDGRCDQTYFTTRTAASSS